MYLPLHFLPPPPMVSAASEYTNSLHGQNSAPFSHAWPTANQAVFIPISLPLPVTAIKLWMANAGTVSGNVDIGIYSVDGTRIVSAGSTAQAGTNTLQTFSITSLTLGAGIYYLALVLDNTTGTLFTWQGTATAGTQRVGIFSMASAFPLPATATFATATSNFFQLFGFSTVSIV